MSGASGLRKHGHTSAGDGGTISSSTPQPLDTTDSPQFAAVNIGNATDTTLTRAAAGDVDIEGNRIYRANGTNVPIGDGGTGASTVFGAQTALQLSSADSPTFSNLSITGAMNVGSSDTTLARASAGNLTVEGNAIYRAGGTDVPIADGGTGASTKAAGFDALSPMTTAGDIIIGGAAGTGTRLAAGSTAGQVLTSNGSGAAPSWQLLASAAYKRTSADYTTSSTTFVDVDGTNMSLSITTGARRVLIGFVGTIVNSAADDVIMDFTVDGTRVGGTLGLVSHKNTAGTRMNASFTYLTDVLTAASHAFKVQYRALSTGTVTIFGTSADSECQFYVMEQGG